MMTTTRAGRVALGRGAAALATVLVVALTVFGTIAPAQETLGPGTHTLSIAHGGTDRTYRLHVPPGHDGGRAAPLVFVLHGGGGTGAQIERYTGFNAVADAKTVIAVYPDGLKRGWNDGRESPRVSARSGDVDDVGFIAALIDHLSGRLRIDARRVYATGISNGGFLSHRLGMALADRFAAIAPIAGTLGENLVPHFAPKEPVAVLHIHGTQDRWVRYEGGEVAAQGGVSISAPRVAELWAKANGCAMPARTERLADRDPSDGTRIRSDRYGACRGGAAVVLYTIEGGGHTWPGVATPMLGATTRDIDGAQAAWDFFERHPKLRP